MPPVRSEEERKETVSEESEESVVQERLGAFVLTQGFAQNVRFARAPDARSFGARRRASNADAGRTSHADDGFLAREIRDVLRVGQGVVRGSSEGGSRRFHGKSSSRVWTPEKRRVAPVYAAGEGIRTTNVSLNDAKMCATPNTCSPWRGLGMWGLISSTTGAATGSSVSACGGCGTREVSGVRDRAMETRAEANARRVFARALSR